MITQTTAGSGGPRRVLTAFTCSRGSLETNKNIYKTSLNKNFDTVMIQIKKKELENIPNTINLQLFVVKFSYIFFFHFMADIDVE